MSFLDPFGLLGPRSQGSTSGGSGDRVRDWLDATSQWADPRWWLTQAPGARTAQRTLLSLAAGLAERFTGRSLEIRAGDRVVRGVLDAVRVDAGSLLAGSIPGGESPPVELRVQAHDVEIEEVVLDRVSLAAQDVNLNPGGPATVSAGPIDVEVRVSDAHAAAWLRRWVPEQWALDTPGHGRVVASRADHDLALEVEPIVRGGTVEVELRSVSWHGIRLRVPGWLRLVRRRPLPPLPAGMELGEVWQADGAINARVRIAHHVLQLRLDQLRDAVARDEPTLVLGDEPA
jgi:hypothetical protein